MWRSHGGRSTGRTARPRNAEERRWNPDGAELILIGHKGHPEVEGTSGRVNKVVLVENVGDVATIHIDNPDNLAYVTQTTLSVDDTKEIIAALKARFLWPNTPGPAKAKVTTPGGKVVEGKVKTNNDFEISLTDAAGNYHYFPRQQVKVEIEDKLTGHRALLPKYSDTDINNLAAYLVTLK